MGNGTESETGNGTGIGIVMQMRRSESLMRTEIGMADANGMLRETLYGKQRETLHVMEIRFQT